MHRIVRLCAHERVTTQPTYLRALLAGCWIVALMVCVAIAGPVQAGTHTAKGSADVLYHNYCSVCHGDRGDGRSRARNSLVPPPRDFTTREAIEQLTRERMIASVTDGRPGTAMVGWKSQLSAPEIDAIVDYIRATFMTPHAAANLSQGQDVYARNCQRCHGDHGQGGGEGKAADLGSPRAAERLTRERMIDAVSQGVPVGKMPGYKQKLSDSEIAAVVDYVRVQFMMPAIQGHSGTRAHVGHDTPADAPAAPTVDMTALLPKGLKGDAARGGKFYQANCATCHGAKGDGQGPRAYFIRPKPRNFLDAAVSHSYNRPFLFAAISAGKLGTEMPAWSKVLTDQQIADVAEYVYRSFIANPATAKAGKP